MDAEALRTEILRLLREDREVQDTVLDAALLVADDRRLAHAAAVVEQQAQVEAKRRGKRAADAVRH